MFFQLSEGPRHLYLHCLIKTTSTCTKTNVGSSILDSGNSASLFKIALALQIAPTVLMVVWLLTWIYMVCLSHGLEKKYQELNLYSKAAFLFSDSYPH